MAARSEVAEKVASYPEAVRPTIMALRALILEVAAEDARIGEIEESLKWGQPAYRPKRARVGTTLRLDARGEGIVAMFYHCQSKLGEQFDAVYGSRLTMDHRSISIPVFDPPDAQILRHCIQMALTYHLKNKEGSG